MDEGIFCSSIKIRNKGDGFCWEVINVYGKGALDGKEMDEGRFCSSIKIRNRGDGFCWEVINVYGPVQYEFKGQFLQELYQKIRACDVPIMVGGDFNMIRYAHEKSL
jgi:hypothetical protein